MSDLYTVTSGTKFIVGVIVDTHEAALRAVGDMSKTFGNTALTPMGEASPFEAVQQFSSTPQPNPVVVAVLRDGFNIAPLPQRYRTMFEIIQETGEKRISLPELCERMGEVKGTVTAMVAKLSGRVRMAKAKAEKEGDLTGYPSLNRNIDALLDIVYDRGHPFYRLTPSGRKAVELYLAEQ